MGVVEDIRQVIQDLVAPQLKSLDARINALDARATSLETSITQRFASAEAVANARHEAISAQIAQLTTKMDARQEALTAQIAQLANIVATDHAAILQKLDLEKRIERIELSQAARYEAPAMPPTLEAGKL